MPEPEFQPDYRHMLDVLANRRPARLPVYEHLINTGIMERILGASFAALGGGGRRDLDEYFRCYTRFFREMTYDTVSFEVCIGSLLPGHGAIMGGRPGPIQNRRDFERYPWAQLPALYWEYAAPRFEALAGAMPPGMKALGGVGNGVFELSEELVGFEYLSYMAADDPGLLADVYQAIGDLMATIWAEFLKRYADTFAICRFGDDLGFKTGLLTHPDIVRRHILPQYRRIIGLVHAADRPFLWHSCGCIFDIMDDVVALGIDAKHSNEDQIAPFDRWIERYGARIGLVGGIDVDVLCQHSPDEVFDRVVDAGGRFRRLARGYALGSGNSIPDYVPVDGYLAMIRAARHLRASEAA